MHSRDRAYGDDSSSDDDGLGEKISRFFNNLFDDESESSRYTTIAKQNSIVSVHTDSSTMATSAAEILDECGAIDVEDESSTTKNSSMLASDSEPMFGASVSPGTPVASVDSVENDTMTLDSDRSNVTDDIDNRSLPVIEEELQVGKREVERGGVRLHSRIVERPVEQSLRLREERVTVERNAANRPATEADFNAFREGEIEVRERAEVPVVNKEARVVEEVTLRKDVNEREEAIRDTVRKTEVEVEKLEDNSNDELLSSTTTKRKRKS